MFHCALDMNQHRNGNGNPMALLSRGSRKRPATPASKAGGVAGEDGVSFKTSEQVPLHGTIASIQRHSAVCELYSPQVNPRLSESLKDFKIILQGREVYSGHAIVKNIVEAGTKIVCETSLDLL